MIPVGQFPHRRGIAPFTALVAGSFLVLAACADKYVDSGSFRIVRATDGMFGLRCQPRTELYFIDRSSGDEQLRYLGTCSTPRFVTEHMHLPGDPSCFAISADGASLVYFHRPQWCGAGEKASRKPGGVYRYTAPGGDALLYSEKQVGQVWSRTPIGPHSIRVSWHGAEPSRGGAVCSQNLVIAATGDETPEGEPYTVHGCRN